MQLVFTFPSVETILISWNSPKIHFKYPMRDFVMGIFNSWQLTSEKIGLLKIVFSITPRYEKYALFTTLIINIWSKFYIKVILLFIFHNFYWGLWLHFYIESFIFPKNTFAWVMTHHVPVIIWILFLSQNGTTWSIWQHENLK